jgi:hypothetical protein
VRADVRHGLAGSIPLSPHSGLDMKKGTTNKHTVAQTRRNLLAAASILVRAVWSRRAHTANGSQSGGAGAQSFRRGTFLRGTLIRTPSGEREISSLAIGDLVVTYSGQQKPIKWIGRRSFHRDADQPWSADVAPIKVAHSALAEGVPHRDLYLSPRHALYLDGLLVTIGSIVNGSTIVRCDADELRCLEYFNLELAEHEIVFAEGAPSDTLLPSGEQFDNWSERARLERDKIRPSQPIAPVIDMTGGRLQLRSRLQSALAILVDRRTDFDILRDRIEDRAERISNAQQLRYGLFSRGSRAHARRD